jgi:hypothetical protein
MDDPQKLTTIRLARSDLRTAPGYRASDLLLQVRDGSMNRTRAANAFEKKALEKKAFERIERVLRRHTPV